jgi:acylphosphatase
MKAKRVVISGRVQGVGYRAWLVEQATSLGLAGWVRNRADGTVEALLYGEPDSVEEMLRACRRGPRMALVTEIEEHLADDPPTSPGFRQMPTQA